MLGNDPTGLAGKVIGAASGTDDDLDDAHRPNASTTTTLSVVRFVSRHDANAFEEALTGVLQQLSSTCGYVGTDIVRPRPSAVDPAEWQALIRFATEADLDGWLETETAKR